MAVLLLCINAKVTSCFAQVFSQSPSFPFGIDYRQVLLVAVPCRKHAVNLFLSLLLSQETVDVFLSRPTVKDELDNEGRTAFLWAAGNGANAVITRFIEHGVDLLQMDKTGATGR
jgi:ankyrin repeat protein